MANVVGNFFLNILRSFDVQSYPRFFRQKVSTGLWYLAGVLALGQVLGLPASARSYYLMTEEWIKLYERNLADVRFNAGEARFEETACVVRHDELAGGAPVTFVIDTSGLTEHEAVEYENPVVITRERIWQKRGRKWYAAAIPEDAEDAIAAEYQAASVRANRWSTFLQELVFVFLRVYLWGYAVLAAFAFVVTVVAYAFARFAFRRQESLPGFFVIVAFALTPLLLALAAVAALMPPPIVARSLVVLGLALFASLVAFGTRQALKAAAADGS